MGYWHVTALALSGVGKATDSVSRHFHRGSSLLEKLAVVAVAAVIVAAAVVVSVPVAQLAAVGQASLAYPTHQTDCLNFLQYADSPMTQTPLNRFSEPIRPLIHLPS